MSKNIRNLIEQQDCRKKKKQCVNILIFKSQKIVIASNAENTFKDEPTDECCKKREFRV